MILLMISKNLGWFVPGSRDCEEYIASMALPYRELLTSRSPATSEPLVVFNNLLRW
jgi:hypothetical protein